MDDHQLHYSAKIEFTLCLAGNIDAARATYSLVLSDLAPDLVEAIVQAANFERRQSNQSAACKAFEDVLEREEAKEGKEGTQHLDNFSFKLLKLCKAAQCLQSQVSTAIYSWPDRRQKSQILLFNLWACHQSQLPAEFAKETLLKLWVRLCIYAWMHK